MIVLGAIPRPRWTPRQEFGEIVFMVLLLGKGLGHWLLWPSYSPGESSTYSWKRVGRAFMECSCWGHIRPSSLTCPCLSPVYSRPWAESTRSFPHIPILMPRCAG